MNNKHTKTVTNDAVGKRITVFFSSFKKDNEYIKINKLNIPTISHAVKKFEIAKKNKDKVNKVYSVHLLFIASGNISIETIDNTVTKPANRAISFQDPSRVPPLISTKTFENFDDICKNKSNIVKIETRAKEAPIDPSAKNILCLF